MKQFREQNGKMALEEALRITRDIMTTTTKIW